MGADSGEALGSGSRMSAPSPRPSAFLGIGNDLLGELRVAFCALAVNVVKNDRFTKTWRFREADIAGNHALKDWCSEETAQIRGNLTGKTRPLIIHRKQDPFDFEGWIEGAPDAHQRVQQLRNTLQRQIFTLDGYQHSSCRHESVQSQQIQGR